MHSTVQYEEMKSKFFSYHTVETS